MFQNELAEVSVLAGVVKYDYSIFLDCLDLIDEQSFSCDVNRAIFKCIDYLYKQDDKTKIDEPSILLAANSLHLTNVFKNKQNKQILSSVFELPVEPSNTVKFAAKLKKIQVAKELYLKLENAKHNLVQVTGDESINDILNYCDINIQDCFDTNIGSKHISEGLRDRIEDLIQNPVTQVGIPTGFPIFDRAIGGGLRGGTVTIFGARSGVGKSTICTNIAYYIAGKLNIPVLYLDTEMRKEEQEDRILALLSKIDVNEISNGKFSSNSHKINKLTQSISKLENIPYYHLNISGQSFESQINSAKQWLIKKVGINKVNGFANRCLVIYDYIKLMDAADVGSMQEYQALGFLVTALHNFAVKYDLPIASTVQLNRDGIDKENGAVISGSDRILWLCSNFAIFKNKSDEEMQLDNIKNGNKKLVVEKSRHGPGMDYGDYINMKMDGATCTLVEGKTKRQIIEGSE